MVTLSVTMSPSFHRKLISGWSVALALVIAAYAEAKGGSSGHGSSGHHSSGDVSVHGYTNKNGTYVASHMRSHPDGDFYNNWSTKGNFNPYTGKAGTKVTPPYGYGGRRASGVLANQGLASSTDDGQDSGDAEYDKSSVQESKPRSPINSGIRLKWATDGLSSDEKATHEELVQALKSRGVNLFYWDLYSNDKLRDIQHQLAVGARPSSF